MVLFFIALYALIGLGLALYMTHGEDALDDFTPFHGLVVILLWPLLLLIAAVVAVLSALSGRA